MGGGTNRALWRRQCCRARPRGSRFSCSSGSRPAAAPARSRMPPTRTAPWVAARQATGPPVREAAATVGRGVIAERAATVERGATTAAAESPVPVAPVDPPRVELDPAPATRSACTPVAAAAWRSAIRSRTAASVRRAGRSIKGVLERHRGRVACRHRARRRRRSARHYLHRAPERRVARACRSMSAVRTEARAGSCRAEA